MSVLVLILFCLEKPLGCFVLSLLAGSGRSRWPGGDLLSHLPPVICSLWLDIVQGYGSINTQAGRGEETDCVCLLPASFCTCRVAFNT